jgi:hypothetical protein
MKTCKAPGCKAPARCKEMCEIHYRRFRRTGRFDAMLKQSQKGEGMSFLQNLERGEKKCISWPYGKGSNGYGVVSFMGRQTTASRVSCIIHNGDPPSKMHEASHICHNGHLGCVNPDHLCWMLPAENTRYKKENDGILQGERHPMARLTEKDVMEIRKMYGRVPSSELAKTYGISRTYIWAIAKKKAWSHME